MPRLKRLFPLTVDYLAASGRTSRVIHASKSRPKDDAVQPVCGVMRPRMVFYGVRCHDESGKVFGVMAMPWPPPAKHGEHERCKACWEATGRKRPDPSWKDLREAT